jgi:hypothetical protein
MMAHLHKGMIGAGIVALALVAASAANATDLGTVGGPAWTLNGDGSFSEAIKGFATGSGTLNTYTFDLTSPASFLDVSVVGNTAKSGAAVVGYEFELSGPVSAGPILTVGTVGEMTESVLLTPGDYKLYVVGLATLPIGATTFGGTVDISPVPLPAALPLFGSVIAGLGIYGARRRKKQLAA